MSLILEALRKSEAERRRGRAPDVHAELPPPPAPRRRIGAVWLVAVVAAVVPLLAAVVFWSRDEAPVTASRDAAPAAQQPTPARDGDIDRTAPSGDAPPPAFPRIDRLSPPAAAAPIEPSLPAATTTRDTPDIARVPETTVPDPPPSAPPTPVAIAPPQSGASTDPPIRYAELPAAERQQLPPMKLTMHLWNEDPARRFVILDGRRYVEGDRIGAGTISAIDPDGIVVEVNGRRVRVPLR